MNFAASNALVSGMRKEITPTANPAPGMPGYNSQSLDPAENPSLQRFTATGRPFVPPTTFDGFNNAAQSWTVADSIGAGPPNLNPVRFTDDSILSIPVLPHGGVSIVDDNDTDSKNPVQAADAKKSSFWRRKSSSFTKRSRSKEEDFVLKKMTRREYLACYAKDEQGRYVGTEDPAEDCILKREEDLVRYRRQSKLVDESMRKHGSVVKDMIA